MSAACPCGRDSVAFDSIRPRSKSRGSLPANAGAGLRAFRDATSRRHRLAHPRRQPCAISADGDADPAHRKLDDRRGVARIDQPPTRGYRKATSLAPLPEGKDVVIVGIRLAVAVAAMPFDLMNRHEEPSFGFPQLDWFSVPFRNTKTVGSLLGEMRRLTCSPDRKRSQALRQFLAPPVRKAEPCACRLRSASEDDRPTPPARPPSAEHIWRGCRFPRRRSDGRYSDSGSLR